MSHLWQHPYVNVFKHFNVATWKKSTKEGEVASQMDKSLKCTIYRLTGSIPAGNYIQIPKTKSQSLGLTGRYMYILFKAIPSKYFVVHIDVATQDNLIVRISFSNLFKEFKSTSTWLQFPFVCNPSRGSVHAFASMGSNDNSGPAPLSTRWTVLCLDFDYILSMYLNRKYSYIKNVQLCANMLLKNVFTSDTNYEPGISFDESKRSGLSLHGSSPMPREMAFPVGKGDKWNNLYDLIRFPSEKITKKPFDSIQFSESNSKQSNGTGQSPRRVDVSKCVSDRVSMIDKLTNPKQKPKRRQVALELPPVGLDEVEIQQDSAGEVHIFAHPDTDIMLHQENKRTGQVTKSKITGAGAKKQYKALEPDPILKLKRIVGYGGATYRDALWAIDGAYVVYPCHAVIVSMKVSNGHQRFFIGHTDKVSSLSITSNSSLLASGQTGQLSVVRIWKFQTAECLSMCKTHVHSLHCINFSPSGNVLCGVGKDGHGKSMVVLWNTSRVEKHREVTVIAKAHTDVDILRMKVARFDESRLVSCGRDNVRVWRVKEGSLRSAPINLGEYHMMEFTDISFETDPTKDSVDRLVYACSRSGHIFEIDYHHVSVHHVRRLLPQSKRTDKQTFSSSSGIAINSMDINETFCVTGSDDGFLRLWPLDFNHMYIEAEHDGPVTAVGISPDGLKLLAGTSSGNLGVLDVPSRGYTTIMRSHTDTISAVSIDPNHRHIATVSNDCTIRVWDAETLQQVYDFSSPQERPVAIAYHPSKQIFACGFESGSVRVFQVPTTSLLAEHKQHRGKVTGLCFSLSGNQLYSSCSLGSLALYDASSDSYTLVRLLSNTVVRGEKRGPDTLTVSPDGRHLAFIGPSEFTVTVVDCRSLDEVLRVDITSINPPEGVRTTLDTAVNVYYAPSSVKQLLVTTSNNKLLKLDARTGRLLSEIDHIHRNGCTSLTVSDNGKYLVTSGDKVIKVWDYHMRLDINFQVFIGHSEVIQKVMFTPDMQSFLSVGEALYLWDFLAAQTPEPVEGRVFEKDFLQQADGNHPSESFTSVPRHGPPQPFVYDLPDRIEDLSSISKLDGGDARSVTSEQEEIIVGPDLHSEVEADVDRESFNANGPSDQPRHSPSRQPAHAYRLSVETPERSQPSSANTPENQAAISRLSFGHDSEPSPGRLSGQNTSTDHDIASIPRPAANKHFHRREKTHSIAQRRYAAPPNQAGLKLKSVIGFNGNGRNNMIWHPDTGLFAYTSGCVIVLEDLNTGHQNHLTGHIEEISTITLQNDFQVLASASGAFQSTSSQICIWDLQSLLCRKVLNRHDHEIVCLAYSRDDLFLISVGDYRDCSIVVWDTRNYTVLTVSRATHPIHDLKWDPYTVNEFTSIGHDGSVLFWLLDETSTNINLNVHEADIPDELLQTHHKDSIPVEFTALEYAGDSTLYIATNNGKVSAWDTRQNTCFIHWEADSTEIDVLICHQGRLMTGSFGRSLRLWSVVGVGEMRLPGDNNSVRSGGLMMEDEMNLDGAIVTAAFDENLEMGIVGTSEGTLWYINWVERTSIRLVSSHISRVNNLAMHNSEFLASCSNDGSLRVWSIADREQAIQFQVMEQSCTCLAFAPRSASFSTKSSASNEANATVTAAANNAKEDPKQPHIVAGYSDGTVRMFDLNKVEMILKMHPHAVSVTAISFSSDGSMILSGSSDGLIAVSSPTTGMTVRVISDHKGAPITNIDVTFKDHDFGVPTPLLWLATSADRRVSVWSADWSRDSCELVDWLTFPAPAFQPDGSIISQGDKGLYSQLPPSMAKFSREEPDIIVYSGYGMQKQLNFYSLTQRKVIRSTTMTHWNLCFDLCPTSPVIATGANERLLKLVDYYESSFQDYVGHDDSVHLVKFSPDGKLLFTVAHSEILIWELIL